MSYRLKMFLISGFKAKRVPMNKIIVQEIKQIIILKKEIDIEDKIKDFR